MQDFVRRDLFNDMNVTGEIGFTRCEFMDETSFTITVDRIKFNNATFNGPLTFSSISNGKASFNQTTFNCKADFSVAKFNSISNFSDSHFEDTVTFSYKFRWFSNIS